MLDSVLTSFAYSETYVVSLTSPKDVVLFMANPFKGVPFKASTSSSNQSTGLQFVQVILSPVKSGINIVKKHICTMFF